MRGTDSTKYVSSFARNDGFSSYNTNNVIGISSFGESGKGDVLLDHFGFSPDKVAQKVKEII